LSFVQQILHQIQVVFQQVGWKELIDVAVVSLIVYQLLRLVRGTQAIQLIVGLVLLAILGIGANALNLLLLSWLFQNAAPFIVIGILVLFQPELRRILDQVGRIGHLGNLRSPLWAFNPTMLTRSIGEASRAAERLAARRTGAIIAFEREVGLEDYAATGVRINGDVSTEFLQTIFFTNSPLHDGAVIIRGDKILAAGCLLPLPEEGSVRERLGTRHRAAIGLSLASDALIIVVSEETGAISVVENGKITRGLDSEGLRQRLTGSLPTLRPVGTRPLLGWLK
jgi:diadenylate cyclase